MVIAVRVKPAAARGRVGGSHPGVHGPALVVAVTAPPVDGRATEAARRALAAALDVAPRRVSLRTGAGSRDKLFVVAVDPGDPAGTRRLSDRLDQLRAG
ncbi:DUF167 domain-containing protein [Solwaraspora sp. WMMB335]|uniref:DUF167 domain-containing protein n=1 Tax=Solwaraspora sp. WMMB335 TaxID=3404118 RepID=UPI003B95815E